MRLLYKVDKNNKIDVAYYYVKNGNDIVNIKGNKQKRYISLFKNFVRDYNNKKENVI